VALWLSDISSAPSLNLKPNPRGENAKKIMSSPYKKLLRQLRKRKSNRPLNPKPIGLHRMLFLVLQKEENGLLGFNSVWHSIRFRHWPSCSLRWQFGIRRDSWFWLFVLHWSFFRRSQWRRLDTMFKMFQMGAHTLLRCGGKFCLWTLSRINKPSVLFIVYILCIFNFLYCVTILCAFCANYSPPQIRNTCA
jgi:hypothetical protein